MPLDATGYLPQRVLTEDEADDLAVLKAARHRIRHRWRWWRGSAMWPLWVSHCALTAVTAAAGRRGVWAIGPQMLLTNNLPPGWANVAAFNDHSTTRHSDILALFDRAIAELD